MAEWVEPYDAELADITGGRPLTWEPNAPDAVLLCDDLGRGALAQNSHPDDPDQRTVVLRFDEVFLAQMGPPNDEGISSHRLYEAGLKDVRWMGLVRDSALATQVMQMHARVNGEPQLQPLHFIVLSKERVVEVLAANMDVFRLSGRTHHTAAACLSL